MLCPLPQIKTLTLQGYKLPESTCSNLQFDILFKLPSNLGNNKFNYFNRRKLDYRFSSTGQCGFSDFIGAKNFRV